MNIRDKISNRFWNNIQFQLTKEDVSSTRLKGFNQTWEQTDDIVWIQVCDQISRQLIEQIYAY